MPSSRAFFYLSISFLLFCRSSFSFGLQLFPFDSYDLSQNLSPPHLSVSSLLVSSSVLLGIACAIFVPQSSLQFALLLRSWLMLHSTTAMMIMREEEEKRMICRLFLGNQVIPLNQENGSCRPTLFSLLLPNKLKPLGSSKRGENKASLLLRLLVLFLRYPARGMLITANRLLLLPSTERRGHYVRKEKDEGGEKKGENNSSLRRTGD